MTNNQIIAGEILNQLGGINKLNAMLGLKHVIAIEKGVSFKIKVAGAKCNYIKIVLNGNDLYDIELGKIRGDNYKIKHEYIDIFFDKIKEIIERDCEVRLSLF